MGLGPVWSGKPPNTVSIVQRFWPVLVQMAGIAFLASGFGLLAVWAGFAVGGLGLVVFGLAAEVGRR